jgi:phosphate:Na+ symporter
VGEVMVGFGFLFLGLYLIKETLLALTNSQQTMEYLSRFDPTSIGPRIMVVAIGAALTIPPVP